MTFRAIAHRGGSAENPENSLRAFRHAADLGFVEMETDVRGTRDGVAVVHHDATLDRTTDLLGRVRDMTWNQIRRARIHGLEPILRLEELLEAMPSARFTVDAKDAPAVPALVSALRRMGAAHRIAERVTVGSFSGRRLAAVRRAVEVPGSASPRQVFSVYRTRHRGSPVRIDAWAVQVPPRCGRLHLLDDAFIAHAHRLGLEVHVWTIDDPTEMASLIDRGVDGIMTDRPTVLRQVLRDRGRWP